MEEGFHPYPDGNIVNPSGKEGIFHEHLDAGAASQAVSNPDGKGRFSYKGVVYHIIAPGNPLDSLQHEVVNNDPGANQAFNHPVEKIIP